MPEWTIIPKEMRENRKTLWRDENAVQRRSFLSITTLKWTLLALKVWETTAVPKKAIHLYISIHWCESRFNNHCVFQNRRQKSRMASSLEVKTVVAAHLVRKDLIDLLIFLLWKLLLNLDLFKLRRPWSGAAKSFKPIALSLPTARSVVLLYLSCWDGRLTWLTAPHAFRGRGLCTPKVYLKIRFCVINLALLGRNRPSRLHFFRAIWVLDVLAFENCSWLSYLGIQM